MSKWREMSAGKLCCTDFSSREDQLAFENLDLAKL